MSRESFKCDKCKNSNINELWSFGNFGNNENKKKDDKRYCKDCFDKTEAEYDERRSK